MPRLVSPVVISLSKDERAELQRRARAQTLSHRAVVRANIILMLAEGVANSSVARALNQRRRIVMKWGKRFAEMRLQGLEDAERSGRPARFSPCGGDASGQARMRVA